MRDPRGRPRRPGLAKSGSADTAAARRPGPAGSAGRPAGRRSASGRAATTRVAAPRPPGRFTGRAVILGVVLLALALSYVIPVRVYLRQQAEISAIRHSQEAQRAHIAELEAEAAKWRDDEYVIIQARQRLYFKRPGEILMITVWDDQAPAAGAAGLDRDATPEQPGAWWDTLWSSIRSANGDGGERAGDE